MIDNIKKNQLKLSLVINRFIVICYCSVDFLLFCFLFFKVLSKGYSSNDKSLKHVKRHVCVESNTCGPFFDYWLYPGSSRWMSMSWSHSLSSLQLDFSYHPHAWRLLIDSSKRSLMPVLLHNGNKYVSLPVAHSVHLKFKGMLRQSEKWVG